MPPEYPNLTERPEVVALEVRRWPYFETLRSSG
jgi:hypothetical protein